MGMPSALRSVTTLESKNGTQVLNGVKQCVPYAKEASCILVPVTNDQGQTAIFLIDPSAEGVSLQFEQSTNGEPLYTVQLSDVEVNSDIMLGDPEQGEAMVEWIMERANVAIAAIQLGIAEEALRRTAEYTSERKQFGKAIACFQSTSLRCADAYIDIEAMRSTYWLALWRLGEGLPAAAEVGAAKWWACRGGERVVHTAQHLHGGIGSDTDYPLHRYFLWAKQMELSFGGASQQLASLGAILENKNKVVNVL
jgi:alkylation response protein AidB-like acyl-CoA dehydrogenase